MDDEFKSRGNEMNKPISEYKEIPAMEYYPINEVVAGPAELLAYSENSNDNSGEPLQDTTSTLDKYEQAKENLDKITNTADGTKTPDLTLNASAEADAEVAAVEASSASSLTVTSTVASLAGSVTVVAAAAALVASIAGGVLEKEPTIISENYEIGTNYIKYEIDLSELSENMDYKIKISKPGFSVEYPVVEPGLQRQIVPDLLPYRKYDLEIIGVSKEFGEIPYYTRECYTDILPKPKAVFKFTPHFDYVLGRIDLEYETYISDYYKNGSNSYLKIYSGNKLILEDREMPEDHFFKGLIKNVSTDSIRAIAYTDWFNGLDVVYDTEIGSYGYDIEMPADFELKNIFSGSYTFGTECFSQTFDLLGGTDLKINTNFETEDEKEAYRIDVINHKEVIKSVISTDRIVNINLDSYVRNVDLKFTPLRIDGDNVTEYEPTIVSKYDIDPKLFSEIYFDQYESGYYFEGRVSEDYKDKLAEKPLNMKIVTNFKDGTKEEKAGNIELIDGELISIEGEISENQDVTIDQVESFDISITYGDTLITKFNSPVIDDFSLGKADVDDDGNIIIPFDVDLSEFDQVEIDPMIDEEECAVEFDGKQGKLTLENLQSNVVNVQLNMSYVIDGVTIRNSVRVEDYDLGADYDVSYFVSHSGSYYSYFNIKYDATISGKNVNIDLYPEVIVDGDRLDSDARDGKYYRYSFSSNASSITYSLNGTEYTVDVNAGIGDQYSSKYDSNLNDFSLGYYDDSTEKYYVDYSKKVNSDGTVSYYFNPNFVDNVASKPHYIRVEGSYIENGKEKFIYSDLSQDSLSLLNIKDLNYNFRVRAYHKADDMLYDTEFTYGVISVETRDYSNVFSSNETFLGAAISGNDTNDAVMDVTLNTRYLDISKGLTITYGGKEYQIDLTQTSELVFEFGGHEGKRFDYTGNGYGYSLFYYNENDNNQYDNIKVEFYLTGGGTEIDYNASAKYYVKDYFTGSTESVAKKVNIINNTISYTKDNVTTKLSELSTQNLITVEVPDYSSTNSIYKLYAIAYYNGREVGRANVTGKSASLLVDRGYSNLDIQLVEILEQNFSSMNYESSQDNYNIVLSEDGEIETPPLQSIENLISSIAVTNEGLDYNITATKVDSFTEYNLKAIIYYDDGEITEKEESKDTLELTITAVENKKIKNIEIQVLYYDRVQASVYLPMDVVFGEPSVDETIVVPYEIKVANGVQIEGDSTVTVGDEVSNISSSVGNIEIENITSKGVDFIFDLTYQKDGILVTSSFIKHYEFEVDIDYDLTMSMYHDSSYYYVKNDDNGIQVSNNQEDPTYFLYKALVNVNASYKGYALHNFTDFTINVLKGAAVMGMGDATDTILSVESNYSIEGSSEPISIIMLHNITMNENTISSVDSVELSFNIDGGETKSISYELNGTKALDELYDLDALNVLNKFDWVTKNGDTYDLSINTGFDSTANPNYYYKVIVYDTSYNVLKESSDYETSSTISCTGLPGSERGYIVDIITYFYNGITYMKYDSSNLSIKLGDVGATFTNITNIREYYGGNKYGYVKLNSYAINNAEDITFTINPGDSSYTATDTFTLDSLPTSKDYVYGYITLTVTDMRENDGSVLLNFEASSSTLATYLKSVEITVTNKNGDTYTVTI